MQNFTVRERAILVAVIMSFLIGAGHRLWKANSGAAVIIDTEIEQVNHAKN
jgi:hypothetical protein